MGGATGAFGGYFNSTIIMTDYLIIDELANVDSQSRYERLNALATKRQPSSESISLQPLNDSSVSFYSRTFPPFREACWHEGTVSSDDFLPHFTCQAAGDALLEIMRRYQKRELTVLCGPAAAR